MNIAVPSVAIADIESGVAAVLASKAIAIAADVKILFFIVISPMS